MLPNEAYTGGFDSTGRKPIWVEYGAVVLPASDNLSFRHEVQDTCIELRSPNGNGLTLSLGRRESNPYREVRARQAASMLIDRDPHIDVLTVPMGFQAASVTMQS